MGRAADKPSQSVEASRAAEPESVSHCTAFHQLGAVAPLSSQLEQATQAYQDEYEHRHVHQLQRFLGVRFGQNPNDQQIISEILYDVKPDLIVETGTNSGGSAVWMVSMMSMINPSCKVITADVKHPDEWAAHWNKGPRAAEMASTKPQWKNVEFFRGFSTSAGFVNRVAELAASARRVLVVLDSDHSTQNVKAELNALNRFVTPGSYIIAEDSYSTKTPMPAIKEFLASHPEFTTDTGRHYLMFSQHRGGYLRRSCAPASESSQSFAASRPEEPILDLSTPVAGDLDKSRSQCTSFPQLGAVAPLSSQLEQAIQAYQDEYEHRHVHQLQRFLGVRFGQNPNDQQIISEILYDVKPDLIVETGTNSGGSAVWMVSMMSMINPSCKVITADVKHPDEWAAHWNKGPRAAEMASTKPQWKNVEFFRGFSTSAGFVNRVAELAARARRVLVVLDSDHSTQNVKAELNALNRFVTPGSYIIAEDSYSTKTPMPAIKEFLASHPEFTTDTGRHYLMFSQHRGGYLRRSCAPASESSQSFAASRPEEPILDLSTPVAGDLDKSRSQCTSFPQLGAVAPLSSQLEQAIQAYQDEYEHRHVHQLQRFLGVRFGQNPNDQQIISEILYDVKPDLIVETGTNSGGSAVWMVSMMSMINPSCKVITADVKHPDEWAAHWNKGQRAAEMASTKPQWKNVEFFRGFSTSAGFVNRVAELAASARRVLVVLDSDHSTQNVKAELNALNRFVTPGSYIIAEDSYSTKTPMPAIKEFLASHPEFTTDTGRHYLMFSQHRGGYLRRSCAPASESSQSFAASRPEEPILDLSTPVAGDLDKSRSQCTSFPQLGAVAPLSSQLEQAIQAYQDEYEHRHMHQLQRFLGVRFGQNPNDQQIISEILYDVKPDLIVETGTNSGGSAVWMVSMMSMINPSCKVITADVKHPDEWAAHWNKGPRAAEMASTKPQWKNVEFFRGFSTSAGFVNRVAELAASARRVLVVLDSDHSTQNVKAELNALNRFVTPGSYIIAEDSYSTKTPMPAIKEFLASHPEFTTDTGRHYLMFSQHRGGYLRRSCS